jgi:hypothetical protein
MEFNVENIKLESVLTWIADLRAQLGDWGVTNSVLIAAAVVATIFALLSLREVLLWFLKIEHLRGEVKALRSEIRALKGVIEQTQTRLFGEETSENLLPLNGKKGSAEKSNFRFDN